MKWLDHPPARWWMERLLIAGVIFIILTLLKPLWE